MIDVDAAMAMTGGTVLMGTGKQRLLLRRLIGRSGALFDEHRTTTDARSMRPQAARIPALRALRPTPRSLRRIAVTGAPSALRVGRPIGNADFCSGTGFFNAEIAERGAERAEKNLLRPAVAVARRHAP
ncbi:hypothetical protein [Rhodopila globiformis]|uniref:hypothetical protein n=1 Tax=Rhodopila globiformis TaxID=1071 RepID=UPI0011B025E0|nr:hypothetical protein [Rhodopila globiformis]